MTLATQLTMVRIAAIPVFMAAFLWNGDKLHGDWGKVTATVVFIIAAITDYYDGAVARWYKEETKLGKFMDPIADKLLVSTALIAMVEYRALTHIPSWAAIVIIGREFAVTGLRLICVPKGVLVESTSMAKWKTTAQLTLIITALVFLSFRMAIETYSWHEQSFGFLNWNHGVILALTWVAVILTTVSGYDYFRKNWHLLDE